MKRLLKKINASSEANNADTNEDKISFSITDLVDIISQIEELNENVAIRGHEGTLQLAVGDSIYEICDLKSQRYPRRRLRKVES